jgi:hypothetical protein
MSIRSPSSQSLIHKQSSAHSRESGNPGATCSDPCACDPWVPAFAGNEWIRALDPISSESSLNPGRVHSDPVDAGACRDVKRLLVGITEANIGRLLRRASSARPHAVDAKSLRGNHARSARTDRACRARLARDRIEQEHRAADCGFRAVLALSETLGKSANTAGLTLSDGAKRRNAATAVSVDTR